MPRSGTTLLQRLLEANEDVAGGGEFSGMGVATLDLVWAKKANLNALRRAPEGGATDLGLVADLYRRLARERYDTDGLIVDKSINNSAYVGLIAKVFPNAPIVVIERDILDVAWSCFRTCFSSGKAWSWSLENIAAHFLAEQKLIEHWRQLVPDRILTLRYEDLVTDPADVVPRLADFCGLEFQQDMLEFHARKSPVTTASVVQTSEPISDKAIGSAQKVKHRMQPFIDAYYA